MASGADDSQESYRKKLRVELACQSCRRRKIRCTESEGPGDKCVACIDARRECTYGETTRKGPSRRSYAHSLEARLEHSEVLVRQLRSELATAHFNSSSISSSSSSTSEIPDRPPAITQGTLVTYLGVALGNLSVPPPPPDLDRDDLLHMDLIANFEKLRVDSAPVHERPFVGKSSGEALVKVAFDLKRDVKRTEGGSRLQGQNQPEVEESRTPWTSRRMRFSAKFHEPPPPRTYSFKFPPPALLTELVALYFTEQNIYIPLLHRPTFERSIAEGLHFRDVGFATTLLLVCAIGSRWSSDPSVVSRGAQNGTGSQLACGWEWFDQAPPPRDCVFGQATLYDLQYYCLAAQFLEGGSEQRTCWMLIGIGLRLAQDIGVHRRTAQVETPSVKAELFKRAFWALVYMDRTVSCAMGRTCTVQYFDLDLDLPVDCDDEYWEHPTRPFQQPAGVPSRVAFFNTMLHQNNLLAATLKLLYALNKIRAVLYPDDQREEALATQLGAALNDWRDRIPAHLRWDPAQPNPIFFDQSVALHCAYYHLQILIFRAILRRTAQMTVPALSICTAAARACADIVDIQRRRKGTFPVVINLPAAFTSGVILLLGLWSRKLAGSETTDLGSDIASVHKCIAAVRLCEDRWQSAGLLWDILSELASVGQVSLPDTVASDVMIGSQDSSQLVEPSSSDSRTLASYDQHPYPSSLTPHSDPFGSFLPPPTSDPQFQLDPDQVGDTTNPVGGNVMSSMWKDAPLNFEVDDWEKYFNGEFSDISQNLE